MRRSSDRDLSSVALFALQGVGCPAARHSSTATLVCQRSGRVGRAVVDASVDRTCVACDGGSVKRRSGDRAPDSGPERAAADARVLRRVQLDMTLDLEGWRRHRLIGYGAGLAALLTLRETPLDLEFIVDDKVESHGSTLLGIPIVPPTELQRVDLAEYRVVVFAYTGIAIRVIQDRLADLGLGFPDGWIDCSLLHFDSHRRRLKTVLGVEASVDLMALSRLSSIYTSPRNLSGAVGTWLCLELIRELNGRAIDGDVAELGVFEGGNALCSLLIGRDILRRRTVHLFDSFMTSS